MGGQEGGGQEGGGQGKGHTGVINYCGAGGGAEEDGGGGDPSDVGRDHTPLRHTLTRAHVTRPSHVTRHTHPRHTSPVTHPQDAPFRTSRPSIGDSRYRLSLNLMTSISLPVPASSEKIEDKMQPY